MVDLMVHSSGDVGDRFPRAFFFKSEFIELIHIFHRTQFITSAVYSITRMIIPTYTIFVRSKYTITFKKVVVAAYKFECLMVSG